jgi:hypothetical protein|tara:strand:+ start:26 stop:487 length:462 start_codon:yes stop_codon:yes gene_type:complete
MLRKAIPEALKVALKDQDKLTVSTVRLIMAALKDRDIAARGKGNTEGVDEEEILQMLQTMVRQRRDSIEMYEKGGRLELAQQEGKEIVIIERFLPQQFGDDEITAAVVQVMVDVGAGGLKDMGKVMGALRDQYAGQMNFGKASALVKEKLGAG